MSEKESSGIYGHDKSQDSNDAKAAAEQIAEQTREDKEPGTENKHTQRNGGGD